MRKKILLNLLAAYEREKGIFSLDDTQTILLKEYLNRTEIMYMTDDDDISYVNFCSYVSTRSDNTKLLSGDYLNENKPSSRLLKSFLRAEKLDANRLTLGAPATEATATSLPTEVALDLLDQYCDKTSLLAASYCSTLFYSAASNSRFWKKQLLAAECPPNSLLGASKTNTIRNWKEPYATFLRLKPVTRKKLKTWKLLCLSGEPLALEQATRSAEYATDANKNLNPLHFSAFRGSISGILFCLRKLKLDPASCSDLTEKNTLHFAVLSQCIPAIDCVINEMPLHQDGLYIRDRSGKNSFLLAVETGDINVLTHVLKLARLQVKDIFDFSSANGESALHLAASHGHLPMLQYLLDKFKGDLNQHHNKFGMNPFLSAAAAGNIAVMDYLTREWNMAENSKNKDEQNALHLTALSGNISAVKYCIDILLLHIGIDWRDRYGSVPLFHAAFSGNLEIVTYFCRRKHVPATGLDVFHNTSLHFAAAADNPDLIDYLVNHEYVPVDATNNLQKRPLHIACECGNAKTVAKLLELDQNIDPRVLDDDNKSALEYAKDNTEILTLLRDRVTQLTARAVNLHP